MSDHEHIDLEPLKDEYLTTGTKSARPSINNTYKEPSSLASARARLARHTVIDVNTLSAKKLLEHVETLKAL